MRLAIVILAAGRGTRMNARLPKVLQPLGGLPILARIMRTMRALNPEQLLVVCGDNQAQIQEGLGADAIGVDWVIQNPPLGTAHAVLQALPQLSKVDRLLIAYGDIPLIRAQTLARLLQNTTPNGIGFITALLDDPSGCGRVVRDAQGAIIRVVEEKEATELERHIKEINAGFFVVPLAHLRAWLPALHAGMSGVTQESYLPRLIERAYAEKLSIHCIQPEDEWEIAGLNDKSQLAKLERQFQCAQATKLMQQGLTLYDPARFDLRGELSVGKDVVIDINVIIEGRVTVEDDVQIGPNVIIKNSVLKKGAVILANSVIDGATIGSGARVGPFARLRPGTVLNACAQVGNFVEIKNSTVGEGSKVNHLSYIGDAEVGVDVNIGAGTITCNYDGKRKHRTLIEDEAHIGANTVLIAPVRVGSGATVGAGTTLTKDVLPQQLIHNKIQHHRVDRWKPAESEEE
jgi:bifunctional UDP-N-acetylglucosamine pyrophosphorylase/glucosamine-1-phosphate N-acetyltransferase